MSNVRTNLIIVLCSILFSLYLFETYLNVLDGKKDFKDIKKIYEKKTGKVFDERTPREVFEHSKDLGFVMSVPPIVHINRDEKIFPLSGISNSKTLVCNENGYYSSYKSDKYGFNNLNSEWDENNIEFLLIGDSFIQGACVNRPDDIASVLRMLSKKAVLNLGYGGNGPLIEYATLKEYYKSSVKNVLWFYYEGNDFNDLKNELRNKTLKTYLDNNNFSQNLKDNQTQIDKINSQLISDSFFDTNLGNVKKNSRIKYKIIKFLRLDKTKNAIKSTLMSNSSEQKYDEYNFKKILKKTNEYVIKNDSNFYFIYLPMLERYVQCSRFKPCKKERLYKKKLQDQKQTVKKIIDDLGIYFIDIDQDVFSKEEDKLKLFPFGILDHYNAEGYYKVASKVYNIILNR